MKKNKNIKKSADAREVAKTEIKASTTKENKTEKRKLASQTSLRTDKFCVAAAVAIILLHFIVLATFFRPATSTLDSHGYFKQGRLLATEGRNYELIESRAQFTGYTWMRNTESDRYDNIWPVGFPAILAATRATLGAKAVYWVNPAMAALALIAFFVFCRAWIGSTWALASLALFALNPVFNQHVHFNYSHIVVLFFLLTSLALITAGWRNRRYLILMYAAGFCAGCIPAIRLPECLLGPPIFLYVMAKSLDEKQWWRCPTAFAAGAAIPILAFCVWNQAAYGAFWKTGYSILNQNVEKIFSLEHFALYSLGYVQKIFGEGSGFIFAPGALGIVWLCARRETWKEGALLAALILPVSLLQISYVIHTFPEVTRYFLHAYPLLSLAGVWMFKDLSGGRRAQGIVLAATIIALSAAWGLPQAKYSLNVLKHRQNALAEISRMVEKNAPHGSVVVADEVVAQHLDVIGNWKVADATLLEEDRHRLYGRMLLSEKVNAFKRDIFEWAGSNGKVYWVGKQSGLSRVGEQLYGEARFEKISEIVIEQNKYLEDSDYAIRTRHKTSPRSLPQLKRGCFNFDMGAAGRFEMMSMYLLDGSPIYLYEVTALSR